MNWLLNPQNRKVTQLQNINTKTCDMFNVLQEQREKGRRIFLLCNGAVSGKLRPSSQRDNNWTEHVMGKNVLFLNSRSTDTDLENGCVDTERGSWWGMNPGG